jgi:5-methylcytosine-specific restriction endonuclease McrA
MYRHQCADCGCGVGSFIKQKDVPAIELVLDWDDDAEKAGWDRSQQAWKDKYESERAARAAEQEKADREWWDWYTNYLSSPEWLKRRRAVILRDQGRCQACLEREATQAHHLNYKHVGNEPLFDLIAVCRECHERLTQMDRVSRQTAAVA